MNQSHSAEMSDIEVLLPFSLDALVAAESQADVLVDQLGIGRDESLLFNLRSILNAGFRNAISVEPQSGRLQVIRLGMYPWNESICIAILDPGKGFCINGGYPPYPPSLLGEELPLFSQGEETLSVKITHPYRIEFSLGSHTNGNGDRKALGEKMNVKGMGLTTLCRHANRVVMNYDPERGNRLEVHCPLAGKK